MDSDSGIGHVTTGAAAPEPPDDEDAETMTSNVTMDEVLSDWSKHSDDTLSVDGRQSNNYDSDEAVCDWDYTVRRGVRTSQGDPTVKAYLDHLATHGVRREFLNASEALNKEFMYESTKDATAAIAADSPALPWANEDPIIKTGLDAMCDALAYCSGEPGLGVKIVDNIKDYMYLDMIAQIQKFEKFGCFRALHRKMVLSIFYRHWQHPGVAKAALSAMHGDSNHELYAPFLRIAKDFARLRQAFVELLLSCMEQHIGVPSIQIAILKIISPPENTSSRLSYRLSYRYLRHDSALLLPAICVVISAMKRHADVVEIQHLSVRLISIFFVGTQWLEYRDQIMMEIAQNGFFELLWNAIDHQQGTGPDFLAFTDRISRIAHQCELVWPLLIQQFPLNWEQILNRIVVDAADHSRFHPHQRSVKSIIHQFRPIFASARTNDH